MDNKPTEPCPIDADMQVKHLSSMAGLFWLSKDYTSIIDVQGLHEFSTGDIAAKATIQPIGGHYLYDYSKDTPRGRVELLDGVIKIWLGKDVPKEKFHSLVESIIKQFNLGQHRSIIKPDTHWHWNAKDPE